MVFLLGALAFVACSTLTRAVKERRVRDRPPSPCWGWPDVIDAPTSGTMRRMILVALIALASASGSEAAPLWSVPARVLARDDHSANVAPYERALDQLKPRCREPSREVAFLVLTAKRVLRGDGVHYSDLSLLRALNRVVASRNAPIICEHALAAAVVRIANG